MTDAIPAFLDRRPLVYTYTNLKAFENCPHQMYRRYIKKDIPYVESKEMRWGTAVHEAFEFRIGANKPLPDSMRQWEHFAAPFDNRQATVERKYGATKAAKPTGFFENKDVWLRGKLDLTLVQPAESGQTAYMLDWKTGSGKYEDPFELEIGAMLLKINNPQITQVWGQYAWLKDNRLGQLYNLSDFRKTWDKVIDMARQIDGRRAGAFEFEKKKSGLCGWCDVADCENWKPRKE